MTYPKVKFALFFFVICSYGRSETIPWIRIRPNSYTYNDLTGSCTVTNGITLAATSLYFSAQTNGSQIVRAYFKTYPDWPISKETYRELNANELKALRLYQDNQKHFWIERLHLEQSIAVWMLEKLRPPLSCFGITPSPKTINLDPISFEFELDAVKEGVYVSYSNESAFEGKTRADYPYEAKLKLKQERW